MHTKIFSKHTYLLILHVYLTYAAANLCAEQEQTKCTDSRMQTIIFCTRRGTRLTRESAEAVVFYPKDCLQEVESQQVGIGERRDV